MSGRAAFRILIDGPEAGWLTVTLADLDGTTYTFSPSHVPYDSVRDLAGGLLNVLEGRDAIVRWNDEPAEHEFVFRVVANRVNFEVVFLRKLAYGDVERERVFGCAGTPRDVVWPFWKTLRDVESRHSPAEYESRWREPFPVAEVAELGRRLQSARGAHP